MQKFEVAFHCTGNAQVKIALLAILKTKSLRTQEDKKQLLLILKHKMFYIKLNIHIKYTFFILK